MALPGTALELRRDTVNWQDLPAHEQIYRLLRERILFGGFDPGRPVTLRGLAGELDVSPMPVREAVRRLMAERAIEMHGNRRVSVPAMSRDKFEQIVFARSRIEPELAARALFRLNGRDLAELVAIDEALDICLRSGDVEGYMQGNYNFHFTLYERSEAATLIALTESLWLQFGPFMRSVYGRVQPAVADDQHKRIIAAIEQVDEHAIRTAVYQDIMQGMRVIGEEALTG